MSRRMTVILLSVAAVLIMTGVLIACWAFSSVYSRKEPQETTAPTTSHVMQCHDIDKWPLSGLY